MRNVKVGQRAEVTLRALPGQTFEGTVVGLYRSSPDAEYQLDGATPEVPDVIDTTYVVTINVDLGAVELPPGSSGEGVIFTEEGKQFQVIQQIALRMSAWVNFF